MWPSNLFSVKEGFVHKINSSLYDYSACLFLLHLSINDFISYLCVCGGARDRTQHLIYTQESALPLIWNHLHSPKGEFIFLSKIYTNSIFNFRFYLNFDSWCIYQIHW